MKKQNKKRNWEKIRQLFCVIVTLGVIAAVITAVVFLLFGFIKIATIIVGAAIIVLALSGMIEKTLYAMAKKK